MEKSQLIKLRQDHVAKGVNQFIPAMVAEAKGVIVRDVEGREFLDFSGGIGELNVGHCPDIDLDRRQGRLPKVKGAFHGHKRLENYRGDNQCFCAQSGRTL